MIYLSKSVFPQSCFNKTTLKNQIHELSSEQNRLNSYLKLISIQKRQFKKQKPYPEEYKNLWQEKIVTQQKISELNTKMDVVNRQLLRLKGLKSEDPAKEYKKIAADYHKKGNHVEAKKWYKRAADLNDAQAQYNLGTYNYLAAHYFIDEKGPSRDVNAKLLFKKSALQKNAAAQHALALCYSEGDGGKKNMEKARFWFQCAADQNYALSQYHLSECLFEGKGGPKDSKHAFVLLQKAAAQDLPDALYKLGICYELGIQVEKAPFTALGHYQRAAKLGHPKAQEAVGYFIYRLNGEDNQKIARHFFGLAAKQGIARSQFMLGLMCSKGLGGVKNINLAMQWYRKAAEQGHPEAMYNLAVLLGEGLEVEFDLQEARRLFEQSAKLGFAKAQFAFGFLYHKGNGIEKNLEKAKEWYRKSADQGYSRAQYKLAKLLEDEGDGAQAFILYQKAAASKLLHAQYRLGLCYEKGIGCSPNPTLAMQWVRTAAERDHAKAQNTLGRYYEQKFGEAHDFVYVVTHLVTAREWYQKAADRNNLEAIVNLARCFEKGIGGVKDEERARLLYRNAASKGSTDAKYQLGRCFEEGIGGDRDGNEARMWMKQAADENHLEALFSLGRYSEKGIGGQLKVTDAIPNYQKAAQQGHVEAQFKMGLHSEKVSGEEQNARYWYYRSAEQGHVDAMDKLAWYFCNGVGGDKNLAEACRWYQKAAAEKMKQLTIA